MRLRFFRYVGLAIATALLAIGWTIAVPALSSQPASSDSVPAISEMPLQLSQQGTLHQPIQNSEFKISNYSQLTQQGRSLYESGQYAAAITVWQQAERGFAAQTDRLNQAMVLSNLALAYQQLGQFPKAMESIQQSLILVQPEQRQPERLRVLAQALTTQGSLQLAQGQTEQAVATWQQAAAAYQRIEDGAGVIRSLINQAQALQAAGLTRRAETQLEQVSQRLDRQPDTALKAAGLINFGDALRLAGKLTQSQQVLQQGLAIAEKAQSGEVAAALLSLGNTARAQQQPERALAYYQKAAIAARAPVAKVQAQLNQLSLLVETKRDAETIAAQVLPDLLALPASRTAIYARIQYARFAPPSIQTAKLLAEAVQQARDLTDQRAESYALGYLGQVYEQTGQWTEGLKLTAEALVLAQSHNAPDIAYRWQWQMGRLYKAQGGTKATVTADANYQRAIAAYNAAFTTLQSIRRELAAGNPEAQFSFRERTAEPLYRDYAELLLQPDVPSQENLKRARQVIESLQIAELENFLQEPCVASSPESIDRIINQSNSTTAAIYPIVLNDRLEVILKLPQQPELVRYRTVVDSATVNQTVRQLQLDLQEEYTFETLKTNAKTVYRWLIEPASTQLKAANVKTLVFVLDGALRNLPMAALYDGQHYLVEDYGITVALNLELQNPRPLPKALRVLGASLTDPPLAYAKLFSKLENVNAELDAIAKAGIAVTTIRDRNFTTQTFNQEINEYPFQIVHLATHGQFSSDPQKTFLLTATGSINVDDLEILFRTRGLNRTDVIELLVLSACETASGDNRAALGIAGTTVRAGARSAIASIWSLDDESSGLLMQQFYQQLGQGEITRADALRQAQRSLLHSEQYAHPRYWAPFILVGSWL
ncbi:CHAT domain-containing protein [Leptolyngbya sp. FACHB-36]|uniref:CHAT domain-containing protein n=1 Tax=Leptolyngbya sp. FACHB-36 TaxID=2692808 RepID=UPI0016801039|nr:CHAT domain-containing protein [Leptolyngbya sp. FACHB-36]MBD2018995.1 CHAT domain-containing protein [Leptolyngbya sp. FACHB-36]